MSLGPPRQISADLLIELLFEIVRERALDPPGQIPSHGWKRALGLPGQHPPPILIKLLSKWLENGSGASWTVSSTCPYSVLARWAQTVVVVQNGWKMPLGPPGQFPSNLFINLE